MGGRLSSYLAIGGSKVGWIEAWKETGFLTCWLHREPPYTRTVHSFRRIVGTPEKPKIGWFPFVCWEQDEWHKQCRFNKTNPPQPHFCPVDFLLQHLSKRTDFADDQPIFQFEAGRELREMCKVDLIGKGKTKESFKDDLTPKEEFIIALILHNEPSKGVLLTNEKWSLGRALVARIQHDMRQLGEDQGSPEKKPICYNFEIDKTATPHKYGVSRFPEAVLTPQIQELWAADGPDASPYVAPSNPQKLYDAMKLALVVDIPLDSFFKSAVEQWEHDHPNGDDVDFDPAELDDEPKPTKQAQERAPAAKQPRQKKPVEEPPSQPVVQAPPPKSPPADDSSACSACGSAWPSTMSRCPGCGAEDEEPPLPLTTTKRAK